MIEDLSAETYGAFTKKDGKVIVKFYANWCGDCRLIEGRYRELAETHRGNAAFGQVNTDKEEKLAKDIGITSIPRIIFFENGTVKDDFFEPTKHQLTERITKFVG